MEVNAYRGTWSFKARYAPGEIPWTADIITVPLWHRTMTWPHNSIDLSEPWSFIAYHIPDGGTGDSTRVNAWLLFDKFLFIRSDAAWK